MGEVNNAFDVYTTLGDRHLKCYPFTPGLSLVAQRVRSLCLQCRRPGFDPWVGKIPWKRQWQPTLVLLPGKSHGWRSLVVHGVAKSRTQQSDFTSLHFYTWRHWDSRKLSLYQRLSELSGYSSEVRGQPEVTHLQERTQLHLPILTKITLISDPPSFHRFPW